MSFVSTVLLSAGAVGALGWMALRDHRSRLAARRSLLDDCTRLFDRHHLSHAGEGFPRLAGRIGTGSVDVRLISDTMTIRRLPQLWLQVTVLEPVQEAAGFAVLVRPSGYEFYSLTNAFHHLLDTPASFPSEVIVRGERPEAERTFARFAPQIASILADPKVKEVAVTRNGYRIIRQAAEGRRGDYLLLRQAVFDDAAVPAATLAEMLEGIAALRASHLDIPHGAAASA